MREGGPIVIPGLFDGRGKAFFFVNIEQLRFPLSNTRTRGHPEPARRSRGSSSTRSAARSRQVNLFEVAARSGQTSTFDPTIGGAAGEDPARRPATTGVVNDRTDPNAQDYLWQPESLRIDNVPDHAAGLQSRRASTG